MAMEPPQVNLIVLRAHPAPHGILQGVRLLHDLLQHEVVVPPLLDLAKRPLQLVHLLFQGFVLDGRHFVSGATQGGHFSILQVHDLPGVLHERGSVGTHEILAVAHAQDEGTPIAGHDEKVRILPRHDGDAVRPHHLGKRLPHRFREGQTGFPLHLLDKLHEDLRVGLALKTVALVFELLLNDSVVFDDAVVHQSKGAIGADVGVRIDVIRRAVGRPARVSNADGPGHGGPIQTVSEIVNLSLLFLNVKIGFVDRCETGRVVPTVFEALEPCEQQILGLLISNVSDNSAHRRPNRVIC